MGISLQEKSGVGKAQVMSLSSPEARTESWHYSSRYADLSHPSSMLLLLESSDEDEVLHDRDD